MRVIVGAACRRTNTVYFSIVVLCVQVQVREHGADRVHVPGQTDRGDGEAERLHQQGVR